MSTLLCAPVTIVSLLQLFPYICNKSFNVLFVEVGMFLRLYPHQSCFISFGYKPLNIPKKQNTDSDAVPPKHGKPIKNIVQTTKLNSLGLPKNRMSQSVIVKWFTYTVTITFSHNQPQFIRIDGESSRIVFLKHSNISRIGS